MVHFYNFTEIKAPHTADSFTLTFTHVAMWAAELLTLSHTFIHWRHTFAAVCGGAEDQTGDLVMTGWPLYLLGRAKYKTHSAGVVKTTYGITRLSDWWAAQTIKLFVLYEMSKIKWCTMWTHRMSTLINWWINCRTISVQEAEKKGTLSPFIFIWLSQTLFKKLIIHLAFREKIHSIIKTLHLIKPALCFSSWILLY